MFWLGGVHVTIIRIYVAIVLYDIVQVVLRGVVQVAAFRVFHRTGSFQSCFSAKCTVQAHGDDKLNRLERHGTDSEEEETAATDTNTEPVTPTGC